jgi:hypothetical protein
MNMLHRYVWFAVSFALLGLVGAKGSAIPPLNKVAYADNLSGEPVLVQTIDVDQSSAAVVEQAIIKAATKRGWTISMPEQGVVQAKLMHRKHDSTLQFKYDARSIRIYSQSYRVDTYGKRLRRDEPDGWIRNLHRDILQMLGLMPAS